MREIKLSGAEREKIDRMVDFLCEEHTRVPYFTRVLNNKYSTLAMSLSTDDKDIRELVFKMADVLHHGADYTGNVSSGIDYILESRENEDGDEE